MSRQFICDWCRSRFAEREHVAHVEVQIGAHLDDNLHICAKCSPDFLKQQFPDDPKPIQAKGEWGEPV